jgi:hypothetical protein
MPCVKPHIPNAKTAAALQEILDGRGMSKSFSLVEEFMADLKSDNGEDDDV